VKYEGRENCPCSTGKRCGKGDLEKAEERRDIQEQRKRSKQLLRGECNLTFYYPYNDANSDKYRERESNVYMEFPLSPLLFSRTKPLTSSELVKLEEKN
jgi:hypothetical protein